MHVAQFKYIINTIAVVSFLVAYKHSKLIGVRLCQQVGY
jgi:hypothetical protein